MSGEAREGTRPNRRWIAYIAAIVVVLAAGGLGGSWLLLSRWSELLTASRSEAERAFMDAETHAGDSLPYVEISETGAVLVH